MRNLLPLLLAGFLGCHHGPRRYVVDPPPHPAETLPVTTEMPSAKTPVREDAAPSAAPIPRPTQDLVLPERAADDAVRAVNTTLADIFFPYDRSELTAEALAALDRDALLLSAILADFPRVKIAVEGHCDERGSAEYNLALGDRRAQRAAEILTSRGVPGGNLQIVSYGKEQPACGEPAEGCWQRNRRVHFTVAPE